MCTFSYSLLCVFLFVLLFAVMCCTFSRYSIDALWLNYMQRRIEQKERCSWDLNTIKSLLFRSHSPVNWSLISLFYHRWIVHANEIMRINSRFCVIDDDDDNKRKKKTTKQTPGTRTIIDIIVNLGKWRQCIAWKPQANSLHLSRARLLSHTLG